MKHSYNILDEAGNTHLLNRNVPALVLQSSTSSNWKHDFILNAKLNNIKVAILKNDILTNVAAEQVDSTVATCVSGTAKVEVFILEVRESLKKYGSSDKIPARPILVEDTAISLSEAMLELHVVSRSRNCQIIHVAGNKSEYDDLMNDKAFSNCLCLAVNV